MSAADELRRLIDIAEDFNDGSCLRQYLVDHSKHIAALIAAAEATINNCDKPSCATCGKLQTALKPFTKGATKCR